MTTAAEARRQFEREDLARRFPYRRKSNGYIVGFEQALYNSQTLERIWWIGKPWRRIELLVTDHIWKREIDRESRSWSLDLHFGFRGWGVTWSLIHSPGYGYEEERL